MKFFSSSEHLYWWPVEVEMPSADPDKAGSFDKHRFRMQFAAQSRDEAQAEADEIAALPAEKRHDRRIAAMMAQCRDWRDVVDDANGEVPFDQEALGQMMQSSWFRLAVFRAYEASLLPDAARQGN